MTSHFFHCRVGETWLSPTLASCLLFMDDFVLTFRKIRGLQNSTLRCLGFRSFDRTSEHTGEEGFKKSVEHFFRFKAFFSLRRGERAYRQINHRMGSFVVQFHKINHRFWD